MAFAVAAAVIAGLLFALALLVAGAQERTVEALRARAPTVKVWGGRVLVVVGAWLAALGIWAGTFARLFPV